MPELCHTLITESAEFLERIAMHRPFFTFTLAAVAAMAATTLAMIDRILDAIERIALFLVNAVSGAPPMVALARPGRTPRTLASIDPALFNQNRHEANVSRRSADRHT